VDLDTEAKISFGDVDLEEGDAAIILRQDGAVELSMPRPKSVDDPMPANAHKVFLCLVMLAQEDLALAVEERARAIKVKSVEEVPSAAA
jgi:hypothetical protein